jgi:hypothetical protein
MQDIIAEDPDTHGSMFVPIILGSDKTTVSVATGDMLAVSIMMKTIKIKTLLEVLLRDASG